MTIIGKDKVFLPARDRVFVFGSNLGGIHGAGAAKQAYQYYGAMWGKGVGYSEAPRADAASYAIPTKDRNIAVTLPLDKIKHYVEQFLEFAESHPGLKFFVTRIGCGLAGYTDDDIAPLFFYAPANCELPEGWPREER